MNRPMIQEFWILRWVGDLDGARAIRRQLASEPSQDRWQRELRLMDLSFLRRSMQNAEALALTKELLCETEAAGAEPGFHLLLQLGIGLSVAGQFADALLVTMKALRVATSDDESFMARHNVAVDRFNLGIPLGSLLRELRSLEPLVDARLRKSSGTVRAMEFDQAFIAGHFQQVVDEAPDAGDQAIYQQAWATRLPWTRASGDLAAFADRALTKPDMFGGLYCLETIFPQRDWISSSTTLQLRIDRLYLWTWVWIADPQPSTAHQLATELARFPWSDAMTKLTALDAHLLSSAIGWLQIFDQKIAADIKARIAEIASRATTPSEFFELDSRVRLAVAAERTVAFDDAIQNYPQFADYLRFTKSLIPQTRTVSSEELVVDPEFSVAHSAAGLQTSETIVNALAALIRQQGIDFPTLLEATFGITQYDDVVHEPKIRNLLQKVKRLLPTGVTLSTRQKRIFLDDPKGLVRFAETRTSRHQFPKVHIQRDAFPKTQVARREIRSKATGRRHLLQAFEGRLRLTAKEIQIALGLSRATALRTIRTWVDEGLLSREGRSHQTTYRLGRAS